MSQDILTHPLESIDFPDSDGKPMADNTLQFRWIVTLAGGLDALYAAYADVFVAGDLLWYPVKGRRDLCQAADVLVVFGRPKGYRRSYLQWKEATSLQVVRRGVAGNLSPRWTQVRILRDVRPEEYYVYDPDDVKLFGWLSAGETAAGNPADEWLDEPADGHPLRDRRRTPGLRS